MLVLFIELGSFLGRGGTVAETPG